MRDRWHAAGRLWDILRDLASAGELPLPQYSPGTNFKRGRDSDEPIPGSRASPAAASAPSSAPAAQPGEPRTIAGSRRVSQANAAASSSSSMAPPSNLYGLPLHSEDLGRMPLHPPASTGVDAPSPYSAWYTSMPPTNAHAGTSAMAAFEMDSLAYEQMMAGFPQTVPGGEPVYGAYQPPQAPAGMGAMGGLDTSDTIAMWSTAPSGFE